MTRPAAARKSPCDCECTLNFFDAWRVGLNGIAECNERLFERTVKIVREDSPGRSLHHRCSAEPKAEEVVETERELVPRLRYHAHSHSNLMKETYKAHPIPSTVDGFICAVAATKSEMQIAMVRPTCFGSSRASGESRSSSSTVFSLPPLF